LINNKFKDNWRNILEFNSKIEIWDRSKISEEEVRIPLTPITIKASILYYLFEILYPKFINDQQNILDIIISDEEKEILGLYLYQTSKAGIHETIQKLPNDIIKLHKKDYENIDKFFKRIQETMMKKNSVRISSIRMFYKEGINLLNRYSSDIEEKSIESSVFKIIELIQTLFEKNLFLIYPEPTICRFLKEFFLTLNNIRLYKFFKFLYKLLPEFNLSFLLSSEKQNIILHLQKIKSNLEKSNLRLELKTFYELGIDNKALNRKVLLNKIQESLKTEKTYFIKQKDLISIFTDFIELLVPIKKENLKFLFQELLFGYRSFEDHWELMPRPLIYNSLIRFLLRLLGFNYNLRKISHWSIPDLIFDLLDSFFGLNSKVLVLFTDVGSLKKLDSEKDNYLKNSIKNSLFLEIENSTLTNLKLVSPESLFSNTESNSLESIRSRCIKEFGFITAIIVIDNTLIKYFIEDFIYNHSKFALTSKLKMLKMVKNEYYFNIFPKFPLYKVIKKRGIFSNLRLFLPILIDKHEF